MLPIPLERSALRSGDLSAVPSSGNEIAMCTTAQFILGHTGKSDKYRHTLAVKVSVTEKKVNTNIITACTHTHTHPESLPGPISAAHDDGVWASHGADVFQPRATAHGHRGNGKVLHR